MVDKNHSLNRKCRQMEVRYIEISMYIDFYRYTNYFISANIYNYLNLGKLMIIFTELSWWKTF
jgi:hypothetical protein